MRYVPTRSEVMGADLSYSVFLPPGYDREEELPLVVFLHGGGDDPQVFDRYDVAPYLDREMRAGRVPRAVIVLPRGDNGFWVNWHDGSRRYRDWIIHELMPEVRDRYGTAECPAGCHVMGVSMGGFGTLRYAMEEGHRFASASILSGPILATEQMMGFASDRLLAVFMPVHRIFGPPNRTRIRQEDPFVVWHDAEDVDVRLFVAWGTEDRPGVRRTGKKFVRHLREHEIPFESHVYDGGHNWKSWTPVIARALRAQLGNATP